MMCIRFSFSLVTGDTRHGHRRRLSGTAKRPRQRAVGEPICAANWGNRRSLKAGAHPCQNASTHREKRLRGAGFDAPPPAPCSTEIIGFAQRAKRGGPCPPLRRQPD
ncbi:hypothetical protein SJA_C2-04630 [Sphingobium indicum UT26S]|uniref:Uncharacterized protein n=1 Tax=Sphingobium indicum (strain DSM 16413 / CCM 7287 / MTCC 6362 / UT26 / NBRC 101211 / UT26S) TaxID=452662 RepID=D4Z8K7_SPHIU|nr:hypothetical protein SJA_C2-04630 [Sphingobium indicum UT26S]